MALEPTDANLQALANVLRTTLGDDDKARKAATAELTSLEARPGYSLCLLQLLATPTLTELPLKQSAAIAFKNFVLHSWNYDGTDRAESGQPDPITASDRAAIKTHLLTLMVSQPKQIQTQLGQSLAIISQHDFPSKWSNLLPELVGRFTDPATDQSPEQLVGVLEVCHSIFYRYRIELKSEKLWLEIKTVLEAVCDPLSALFLKWCARLSDPALASNPAALPTIVNIIALIADLFLSLSSQDIPAQFEEPGVLRQWFSRFIELLQYTSPLLESQAAARSDPDEPTKLDTLKASICDVISLYSYKYEDQFAEFVPAFVEVIWAQLAALGEAKRFDLLVGSAVRFLTAVVKKEQFKHLFANETALKTIAEKVVIPQLKLRDSDVEMFEYNAQEYIRVDIEGSDVDTRRRNAVDFIHGLTVHFESQISAILKGYVDLLLAEYERNKTSEKGVVAKDAAMYIILALSAKSKSASKGITQTNPYVDIGAFFQSQVVPELSGPLGDHPILKADCLKYLTIFRTQLPAQSYAQLFPLIMRYLQSEHVVLHTYASYAIERMLAVKEPSGALRFDKEQLKPFLQKMLEGLFAVLNHEESKENEYVMKAIMRVCSVGQDGMVPFAPVIISKITAILQYVSANPKNPKFNHALFESIAALVKYLCKSNPGLVDSFEAALFGPFQAVLGTETAAEFGPYVFQILAQLLEFRGDLSAPYQAIFPALLAPALWKNSGNVPAVTRLLQAYLSKPSCYSSLLSGANKTRLEAVLGIFQELLRLRSTEAFALDLLGSLVTDLEPAAMQPYLATIFNKMLFPKLQPTAKPTARLFKATTQFFLAFLAKHGLETVVSVLNTVQPGIFSMLFDKILLANAHYLTTESERRLGALALTTLLARSQAFLADPAFLALWPRTLLVTVKLLTPKASKELHALSSATATGAAAGATVGADGEEVDDPDDLLAQADKGFSTAYARLVFAGTPESDLFPAVTQSPKEFFAQSIDALFAQYPGKFPGMLASLSADDQKIVGTYFQTNNIQVR